MLENHNTQNKLGPYFILHRQENSSIVVLLKNRFSFQVVNAKKS